MDELFTSFISLFNSHIKANDGEKISVFKVDRLMREKYGSDRTNLYDKVGEMFPTIDRYILDNYYKVYNDDCQIIVSKNTTCHLCTKTFEMCRIGTTVEGELIHKRCCKRDNKNNVKFEFEKMFSENNKCKICSDMIVTIPVMHEDNFYHKQCCVNMTIDHYKNLKCFLCDKPIERYKNLIEFCSKDNLHVHTSCAKASDRSIKYKKTKVHLSLNRCCVCGFYTSDSKQMHTICQNKLKNV